MNTKLLAATAALSLIAATAYAETEGAGNPFAFQTPGTTFVRPQAYADTGSTGYPALSNHAFRIVSAGVPDVMSATGSEGLVQTPNSLPRGFEKGTVAYAQGRSAQNYFAEQAAQPIRDTRTTLVHSSKPHG